MSSSTMPPGARTCSSTFSFNCMKGPSRVMWAKDDEIRQLIASGVEVLQQPERPTAEEAKALASLVLEPAIQAVEDMIYREEQVLFPMSIDSLEESEWYSIHRQSPEIGFCLYDPETDWTPDTLEVLEDDSTPAEQRIQLPSGRSVAQ